MSDSSLHLAGIIGPDSKFYGYIIGLHLERGCLPDSADTPSRMFATFEYGGSVSVWEVPDFGLFKDLAGHLCGNAEIRALHGEFGYAKLWIGLTATGWEARIC